MTASADRFRLLVGVTLGGVLAASCIQIEDASDKKKAVADSAAGSISSAPSARVPALPASASFNEDSAVRIRGGPQWTAAERAELQSDTAIVRMPALPAPPNAAGSSSPAATPSNAGSPATLGSLIVPVRGIEPSQ